MVCYPESVMWLRTLCFVWIAVCFVMSCHRASGEGKLHRLSRLIVVNLKHFNGVKVSETRGWSHRATACV